MTSDGVHGIVKEVVNRTSSPITLQNHKYHVILPGVSSKTEMLPPSSQEYLRDLNLPLETIPAVTQV